MILMIQAPIAIAIIIIGIISTFTIITILIMIKAPTWIPRPLKS